MLLSWPTWAIHLFTVTEWAVAMGLLWRYGGLIQRRELQVFAVCMGPHLMSGLLILGFHLSGDTARGAGDPLPHCGPECRKAAFRPERNLLPLNVMPGLEAPGFDGEDHDRT